MIRHAVINYQRPLNIAIFPYQYFFTNALSKALVLKRGVTSFERKQILHPLQNHFCLPAPFFQFYQDKLA